jgi:hypothetical protein
MYSWNEWLAWIFNFVEQRNNTAQRTGAYASTQQIVHDNRTATIKDAAGMNGWHGLCSFSTHHMQQRTAVVHSTQQIVYMITVQPTKMHAGMNGWHGSLAE